MVQMHGSRNFHQGGGGEGPSQSDRKSSDNDLFSPQLAYFTKVKWSISKNLSFFMAPDGVHFFPGGPTFSRGCPIAYSL